jgi:hypothetical protein
MRVARTFHRRRRRRNVFWGVIFGLSLTFNALTGYNVWQRYQARREIALLAEIMQTVADECTAKGDDI